MPVLLVEQTFNLVGLSNASVFPEIFFKGHWKCALLESCVFFFSFLISTCSEDSV